jgi:methanogenic corrinoid protein MtbC1
MNSEKRFPIKTVAQKSGLSTHVIRAWEKRYQVVIPLRSETNRRLYSEEDIYRLSLLRKGTQAGHSISSISDLDINSLHQLLDDQDETGRQDYTTENKVDVDIKYHFQNCLNAIKDFDSRRFEESLMRASMEISQPLLIKSLILPLLRTIGDQWKNGSLRVIHEHLATAVLKPFLHNLRISYRPAENAASIVIATPTGQIHEIGALIIGLIAAAEGWRVIYLGPNLPAEEIASATTEIKSKYVLLSIVYPANDPYLNQELKKLHSLLAKDIRIIIGGRASDSYTEVINKIGSLIIKDLDEFRTYLEIQHE